ncbi:MAG: hypothetical protein IIA67_09600, partial [Planctomycetes bacterium]|nr:hypothetical protein [Planctomycetota bacterium]
ANAPPKVGPVVFNEIMYNPPVGSDEVEYIELRSISDRDVPLFDPQFPVNTWKITGGVDVVFPVGITLRPGQLVLVTSTTPERFLQNHSVPSETIVVGPFSGRLDNAGETVRLRKPGKPDEFGPAPMILVDEVSYDDRAPWPLEADGLGTALRRLQIDQYGNDPINWTDSLPGGTPGDLPISPRVEAVILSGTGWSPALLNHVSDEGLGIQGFSLPAGASQFTTIPWTGVDVVRILFSENVTVEEADLMLLGVNTAQRSFADFTYDPGQFLATWTLAGPLWADRVLLQLSDAIVDSVNLKLDGNWSNGADQFPSGNGSIDPNDDFGFRIDVLPGDVADSGRVDRGDLLAIVSRLSVDVSSLRYDPRRDLNGDGRIDLADLRAALYRLGIRLPSGEPTASGGPSGVVALSAVDTVFHRSGLGAANAVAGAGHSPQIDTARRAAGSTVAARRDATTRRTRLRSPLDRLQAFAVDRAMQDLPDHLSRAARSGRRRL